MDKKTKKLTKFLLIAGILATLSGCAYGTYNTYEGALSPGPREPNYLSNCPLNDQQECHTWFYGQ